MKRHNFGFKPFIWLFGVWYSKDAKSWGINIGPLEYIHCNDIITYKLKPNTLYKMEGSLYWNTTPGKIEAEKYIKAFKSKYPDLFKNSTITGRLHYNKDPFTNEDK
jgi:hypothetical protein